LRRYGRPDGFTIGGGGSAGSQGVMVLDRRLATKVDAAVLQLARRSPRAGEAHGRCARHAMRRRRPLTGALEI
jgi:hypothetical protein